MGELKEKFKKHIHFEEGMDESMLSLYLENAKRYVKNATGEEVEYIVLLVAGIMYEYRVSDEALKYALDAITPFIVQEVYAIEAGVQEETDEQSQVDS